MITNSFATAFACGKTNKAYRKNNVRHYLNNV